MRRTPALLVLTLLVPALLAGCTGGEAERADVVATFYPLAFLAQRIGGSDVTVATAVPAGVEPHDWEPSPRDVTRIAGARVVLSQGAGFEPWLGSILSNLGARAPTLVETTRGLELREGEAHEEEGHEGEAATEETEAEAQDPHTWLDPALFSRQSEAVEAALAAAWPEHADAFRERAAALRADLAALHQEFERGLATCEARVVVANHDAYGYLEARYAFEVESVSGLSPEAEPSAQDLQRVVEVARAHNLTIVFFEELASPGVVEVIAREVGAQTRVLSPVEGAPEEGDYLSRQRENLANLREAMRCS